MFVQHCQGCLIGRNVGDFGRNWRHMTTASTAAQGIMGSSGCDENKIKIAPSVKNVQSNMHKVLIFIIYLHPVFLVSQYFCIL